MFIGSYQHTVLSSLEGWLRRGVVLSGAASVRTSQGDNAATMIVVFYMGLVFKNIYNRDLNNCKVFTPTTTETAMHPENSKTHPTPLTRRPSGRPCGRQSKQIGT